MPIAMATGRGRAGVGGSAVAAESRVAETRAAAHAVVIRVEAAPTATRVVELAATGIAGPPVAIRGRRGQTAVSPPAVGGIAPARRPVAENEGANRLSLLSRFR